MPAVSGPVGSARPATPASIAIVSAPRPIRYRPRDAWSPTTRPTFANAWTAVSRRKQSALRAGAATCSASSQRALPCACEAHRNAEEVIRTKEYLDYEDGVSFTLVVDAFWCVRMRLDLARQELGHGRARRRR